jgi:hypothetical protein
MTQSLTERDKHDYCNKTLFLVDKIEGDFLTLAERLYKVREERLYEAGWGSFEEFCMERKSISKGTASKLITVHELYVVKHKVSSRKLLEVGWTALYAGRNLADSKEGALKFVDDATRLAPQHLKQTITEAKTGVSQADCKHKNAYTMFICPDCGEKHRV